MAKFYRLADRNDRRIGQPRLICPVPPRLVERVAYHMAAAGERLRAV